MLTKRIIPCLDVRLDENGSPVVTKGHQYDVRDSRGRVRNVGDPIELAHRYDQEGADELVFLDITRTAHGRSPLISVIERVSDEVFLPLTIGGGIKTLDDARQYFDAGADKVSLGSSAVEIVYSRIKGTFPSCPTLIEEIARLYGSQACVVSIDPIRRYVRSPGEVVHQCVPTSIRGPGEEAFCWFQCSIKGGREFLEVDAITLARKVEEMGAGEILLNSIDRDGTRSGFDLELIRAVKAAVSIPVIASSGAGCLEHFLEVFSQAGADAALAASLFHYGELTVGEVKRYLSSHGIPVRLL